MQQGVSAMREDSDALRFGKLEVENARLRIENERLQQIEAQLTSHSLLLESIRRELAKLSKGLGVY